MDGFDFVGKAMHLHLEPSFQHHCLRVWALLVNTLSVEANEEYKFTERVGGVVKNTVEKVTEK